MLHSANWSCSRCPAPWRCRDAVSELSASDNCCLMLHSANWSCSRCPAPWRCRDAVSELSASDNCCLMLHSANWSCSRCPAPWRCRDAVSELSASDNCCLMLHSASWRRESSASKNSSMTFALRSICVKSWSLTCRSPTPCWKGKVGLAFGFCFLSFYLFTLCVCVVVVVPVAFFWGEGGGMRAHTQACMCIQYIIYTCCLYTFPHAHNHTLMHTLAPSLPVAVCLFPHSLSSPLSLQVSPSLWVSLSLSLWVSLPLSFLPPPPQSSLFLSEFHSLSLWVSLFSLSFSLSFSPSFLPPPPLPCVSLSLSLWISLSLSESLTAPSLFKPRVVLTFSCCYDGFYHQTVPSGSCSSRYSAWGRCKTDWMNLAPCRTQNWSWNVMLRGQYGNGDCAMEIEHYHCFCRNKHVFITTNVFVTTKQIFCRDKSMLVAKKTLLRQNFMFVMTKYFYDKTCSDNIYTVREQFLGLGKVSLSWPKFCCGKIMEWTKLWQKYVCCNKGFVMTIILMSQQKTCFVMTEIYACDSFCQW